MRKIHVHFLVILLFVVSSCERQEVVDIDVQQKSKIFAAAFIGEGNDWVSVHVSRSLPAIGISDSIRETSPPINDAQVFFQTPNKLYELFYDANENKYLTSLQGDIIQPDMSYRLKVINRGEISEGIAFLPKQANFELKFSADSVYDSAFQTMFYTFYVKCKSFDDNQFVSLQAVVVFEDSSRFSMNPKNMKSAFQLNSGQTIENTFSQTVQLFGLKPVRLEAKAYSISKDLYLYQNKVGQFDLYTLFPFSEPSFIHSNMSTGIGIFGTYRLAAEGGIILQ